MFCYYISSVLLTCWIIRIELLLLYLLWLCNGIAKCVTHQPVFGTYMLLAAGFLLIPQIFPRALLPDTQNINNKLYRSINSLPFKSLRITNYRKLKMKLKLQKQIKKRQDIWVCLQNGTSYILQAWFMVKLLSFAFHACLGTLIRPSIILERHWFLKVVH